MSEREFYNPETGEYELRYDDGIYENYAPPQSPTPAATGPAPPPKDPFVAGITIPQTTTTASNMDPNKRPADFPGWEWYFLPGEGWKARKSTSQTDNTVQPPPKTAGGGAEGAGPDYSQMLPFSPYRDYGAFNPSPYESPGAFTPRDATFEFDNFEPEKFSYESFAPSSYGDLENQPGYKDGQQRLQKQIEAGAAYRGMVRSGMTLGELWNGLDTNKQQRFAEFDGRRARDYSVNRGNAFENFQTNEGNRHQAWTGNLNAAAQKFGMEYGVDKDVYDRYASDIGAKNQYRYGSERDQYSFGATENDRSNNYRFNTEDSSFKDSLARWQEQVRSLTQMSTAGAN